MGKDVAHFRLVSKEEKRAAQEVYEKQANAVQELISVMKLRRHGTRTANTFDVSGTCFHFHTLGIENVKIIGRTVMDKRSRFTSLSLKFCEIDDEGARILGVALMQSKALSSLDLSRNRIGNTGVTALALGLVLNRGLRKLDLSYNQIEDEGIKCLALALEPNHSLTNLIIGYNKFDEEGLNALCDLATEKEKCGTRFAYDV